MTSYVTRLEGAMDHLLQIKISVYDWNIQMMDRLFHGLLTLI